MEKVMQEMANLAQKFESELGVHLELPPKSFTEMKGEFIETEGGRRLRIRFPYDDRFTNSIGIFQGGMLCTAIDNTFGPLSYIALKRPSVTLELSTQFIRAFTPKDEYIEVEASVVSISSLTLVMRAEVKNPKGKLMATATTTFLILRDEMLKNMAAK